MVFDRRRRRIGRCAVKTGNVVFLDRMLHLRLWPGFARMEWGFTIPIALPVAPATPPAAPSSATALVKLAFTK